MCVVAPGAMAYVSVAESIHGHLQPCRLRFVVRYWRAFWNVPSQSRSIRRYRSANRDCSMDYYFPGIDRNRASDQND